MKLQRGLLGFLARYPFPAVLVATGSLLSALGFAQQGYDLWQGGIKPWQLHAGFAALFVTAVLLILYKWDQERSANKLDTTAAPAPDTIHNVTSHNQTGGITAHTVNEAPKPRLKWGKPVSRLNSDGTYTVTAPFDVIAPYPPASIYLKVKSPGIQSLRVGLRDRSGAFVIAESGQGDGWRFAILQHPLGAYRAQVVTSTTNLKFEHKFS